MKDGKRVSYIRFCRAGLQSIITPITGSCIEWFVEIQIDEKEAHTVYKVGLGVKVVSVEMSDDSDCSS